jgi:hypothetical protein
MITRKDFLKRTGTAALASMLLTDKFMAAFAGKKNVPIGLQLYTLGNLMTTDPKGTLQKLASHRL